MSSPITEKLGLDSILNDCKSSNTLTKILCVGAGDALYPYALFLENKNVHVYVTDYKINALMFCLLPQVTGFWDKCDSENKDLIEICKRDKPKKFFLRELLPYIEDLSNKEKKNEIENKLKNLCREKQPKEVGLSLDQTIEANGSNITMELADIRKLQYNNHEFDIVIEKATLPTFINKYGIFRFFTKFRKLKKPIKEICRVSSKYVYVRPYKEEYVKFFKTNNFVLKKIDGAGIARRIT